MNGDPDRRSARAGPYGRGEGPPGQVILEQQFDSRSLHALRSAVAAHVVAAGQPVTRVHEVVFAVHELAANAVRHGAGRGRLRLQADGGALTCQVSDDGGACGAGKNPGTQPRQPWPAEHGHGLWIVGQVADHFTITHSPAGTTATATFRY